MIKSNYKEYAVRVSQLIQMYMILTNTSYEEAYVIIRNTEVFNALERNDYATVYEGVSSNLYDIGKELQGRKNNRPDGCEKIIEDNISRLNRTIREYNTTLKVKKLEEKSWETV